MKKEKMKRIDYSLRPIALLLTLTLLLGSLTLHMPKAAAKNIQNSTSEQTPSAISGDSISANESGLSLSASYGKTPLVFEENQGQTDARVKFAARASGYALYLTQSEAVFTMQTSAPEKRSPAASKLQALSEDKVHSAKTKDQQSDVLRMQFVGAATDAKLAGVDRQTGTTNSYKGNFARPIKSMKPS